MSAPPRQPADRGRCEKCFQKLPGRVLYDAGLKAYVCHECWAKTPIPPPRPRRP